MRTGARSVLVPAAAAALCALVALPASAAPAVGASGAGDPYFPLQGNGGYDVQHYDLRLTYTPSTRQLAGTAVLQAVAGASLSRLDLDLRDGMAVSRVTVDGADAAFARAQGQELVVTPRTPLRSGGAFTVAVTYAGSPTPVTDPDGSLDGWVATSDGAFVVGEPQGAPSWFPANDTPTDKATYDVALTVPEGVTAISNGELVSATTTGGRTTWTWHNSDPTASYLVTATNGTFSTRSGTSPGGIRWFTASDPRQAAKSAPVLAKLPAVADYFQSMYGPYPSSSVGAVVDDAPEVGYALESQTKSMYDRAPDELTLAHEVAHEWFGNNVTVTRWKEIWVAEGFAEFSAWLWSEHTGQRSAQSFFDAKYARPASDPVWTPPPGDPGSGAAIFSGSVYDRGAMTLQALRVKLGDAAFFRLLRGWATARADGNASVQDFVGYASATTGRDLSRFFQTWLYDSGKPTSW